MSNNEQIIETPLARTANSSSDLLNDHRQHTSSSPVTSSASKDAESERLTMYEFIDSRELARRLTVPPSWIRDQVRARSQDPLPHVNLGKYVRFLWGSPALELWIRRHIVMGNNRRLGRTQRKERS
jgi:hypothetical protein